MKKEDVYEKFKKFMKKNCTTEEDEIGIYLMLGAYLTNFHTEKQMIQMIKSMQKIAKQK